MFISYALYMLDMHGVVHMHKISPINFCSDEYIYMYVCILE